MERIGLESGDGMMSVIGDEGNLFSGAVGELRYCGSLCSSEVGVHEVSGVVS